MSYYTYFYPKKDETYSEEELNKKISKGESMEKEYRLLLKLFLIDAYYKTDVRDIMKTIQFYFNCYVYCCEDLERLYWISRTNKELKEYGEVSINHANCDSKNQLEIDIDNDTEYVKGRFDDLMILTRVKFDDSAKEYTDQTFNNWMKSSYIGEIDEILNGVRDIIEDKYQSKFMLDNFDTKKDEDEHNETN